MTNQLLGSVGVAKKESELHQEKLWIWMNRLSEEAERLQFRQIRYIHRLHHQQYIQLRFSIATRQKGQVADAMLRIVSSDFKVKSGTTTPRAGIPSSQ